MGPFDVLLCNNDQKKWIKFYYPMGCLNIVDSIHSNCQMASSSIWSRRLQFLYLSYINQYWNSFLSFLSTDHDTHPLFLPLFLQLFITICHWMPIAIAPLFARVLTQCLAHYIRLPLTFLCSFAHGFGNTIEVWPALTSYYTEAAALIWLKLALEIVPALAFMDCCC